MVKKRIAKRLPKKTILLCLSGSIALYKSCDLLRDLKEEGADVFCLMTKSAQQFVSSLTFHALSGHPVYADPFSELTDWSVLHTTLADKADLVLICPASANIIARLANGMADDIVTSTVLASRAKVLVVPAMNDNMFAHPVTKENIAKLKSIGYHFVEPVKGNLVCGREGMGHIPENQAILESVCSVLSRK
ncbi:MAG: hypothetical protein HY582_01235 [Candidatus Omnitrophica bacterium]|nr:hypothetical protein [Candidatus Omnitrophota bacterium]